MFLFLKKESARPPQQRPSHREDIAIAPLLRRQGDTRRISNDWLQQEQAIATNRDDCDDCNCPHHRSAGRARGDKGYAETATLQSTLYFGRWSPERAPGLDARVASDERNKLINRTRRRRRDKLRPLRTREQCRDRTQQSA